MNYNGSRICPEGRKIQAGETVIINSTGEIAEVKEYCEGEYVFCYYIKVPNDDKLYRFDTDQITPVNNP